MIRRRGVKKSNDARLSERVTAFRRAYVLLLLLVPFSFGCRQRPIGTVTTRPAVWTESATKGCNLERIWTHTLDELTDLTEDELAACRAGCQHDDGAACVGAGLLHYSGIKAHQNKPEARELLRRECNAGQYAACVSLWMTDLDKQKLAFRRDSSIGSLERLDTYCGQGERHACEVLARHFYTRLRTGYFSAENEMAVLYLNRACAQGSLSGCTNLGWLYLAGIGVRKDQKKAATLVAAQCERGHIRGCDLLGDIYDQGLGVPIDDAKAAELFRTACDGGIPMSCYDYGNKHWPFHGTGDWEEAKLAVDYYEKACTGNVGLGCESVGQAYLEGKGVTQDHNRAMEYFEKACNLRVSTACHELGTQYETGNQVTEDPVRAAHYYKAGCMLGDPTSCHEIGLCYFHGYGVEHSVIVAADHFRRACFGGIANACYQVARIEAHGLGGEEKNEYMALRNMERACSGGQRDACEELDFYVRYHRLRPLDDMDTSLMLLEPCHRGKMRACHELGLVYARMEPSGAYSPMAAVVFQKACAGGIYEACTELGNAYVDGRGVAQDVPKGLELIEDACRHRYGWACYSLGLRYRDGNGVTKNDFKAVLLLDDACVRLPEVCEEAAALRERYRAEHEPAKPEDKEPPGPPP